MHYNTHMLSNNANIKQHTQTSERIIKMLKFKTKKEAVTYLQNRNELIELANGDFTYDGLYELSYGESDKPDFRPTRYKDGWGIKKIHFFYPNTFYAPADGRVCEYNNQLVLIDSIC